MTGISNNLAISLFVPQQGFMLWIYLFVALAVGLLFIGALTKVPNRYRKPIVIGVTFLLGWFYFLEFFIPGNRELAPARESLSAAEQHLRVAAQDLKFLALRKDDVQPGRIGERKGAAREEITRALADMREAKARAERVKPAAISRSERDAARANAFAERHRLNNRMLDREGGIPNGAIQNASTQASTKRIADIESASAAVDTVIARLEAVQPALTGPGITDIDITQAGVAGAAQEVALTRTGLSDNFLTPYKEPASYIIQIVGAFSLGLGVFSLLTIHGKAISRRRQGWYNSLAFFIAFTAIIVVGFLMRYAAGSSAGALGDAVYNILFNGALASLQATTFSLVAFYIVSAAYRAFRIRTGETVLMMTAAFLVMLSIVPIGVWLTSGLPSAISFLRFENIGSWIMTIPNAAAQRGIAFGIGVGALAMALRIWLSLERGSFFDKSM